MYVAEASEVLSTSSTHIYSRIRRHKPSKAGVNMFNVFIKTSSDGASLSEPIRLIFVKERWVGQGSENIL